MSAGHPEQTLIDGATRLYGIVGHPIEQVRSPQVMNPRLLAAGRNAVLVPLHILPERFEDTVRGLMGLGNLDGLVVTVPYKARAVALADTLLPTGCVVGAINVLRREPDGRWSGDMFDGRGLVRGLADEGFSIRGRRAMILGAGGAGSAVAVAFAEAGAAALTLHDVDADKAQSLAKRVHEVYPDCAVKVGQPAVAGHDTLVNCTPVGMAPGDGLPAALGALPSDLLVIDAIMKPLLTPLLRFAAEQGCRTIGGKTMLGGQAPEVARFFGFGP